MIKYIRTYDNVLTMNLYKTLIDKFEQSQDQWVKTDLESIDILQKLISINIVIGQNMVDGLYRTLKPYITKYKEDCKITKTQ